MCVTRLVQIVVFLCLSTLGVLGPAKGLQLLWSPRNETIMKDHRLKLYCMPDKDKVEITWYRNGEELPHDEFWDLIKKDTVLRFTSVQVHHRGEYKCRAQNMYKESVESNPASLTVHAPAVIMNKNGLKREVRLLVDTPKSIVCNAAGIPFPAIEWRKNGQLVKNNSDYERFWNTNTSEATLSSKLEITVNQSAIYTCVAINIPIVGPRNDSVDFKVIVIQPPNDMQVQGGAAHPAEPGPVCAPYKGTFCRDFLRGRVVSHDKLNTTSGMGDWEERLAGMWEDVDWTDLMTPLSKRNWKELCRGPAKRLLCHWVFPDCDKDTGRARSVCRESCLAVKMMFCFRPWVELEYLMQEGKLFKDVEGHHLPDCTTLPSKWNPNLNCTESDHHDYSPSKVSDDCFTGRGRWYNGTVNVTVSGRVCQAWSASSPQDHDRLPQIFPELMGSENYCRNPGAEEDQPWCYTTDKKTRWETCNVRKCGPARDTKGFGLTDLASENDEEFLFMVILISTVFVAFVILAIAVPIMCWRRRRQQRRPHYNATPQNDTEIDISNVPINSAYHQIKSNRLDPKLESLEFPRNDMEYIRDLGQGAFGRVFQARLVCSNGNSRITGGKLSLSGSKYSLNLSWEGKHCKHSSKSIGHNHSTDAAALPKDCGSSSLLDAQFTPPPVVICDRDESSKHDCRSGQLIAVKMLKEDASDVVQADFEREASLMVNFDHPNIVRLLGVCTVGKPMCLLFEYMSKGDLNEFLRQCSLDLCLIPSNSDSIHRVTTRSKLELADQLSIAAQVASGMTYLSDRGYVHRDLATRNCLVSCGLVVKIADFGLARSVHSMDYYCGSDKDAIPIRWMPPEAILYNKFSSQSDVWSFGVLLWEIFSYALQPYYGMTHEEVINYLCGSKVLVCPDNTPPAVYELMTSCWKRKPKQRPNFSSLRRSLTVMCDARLLKSGTQQSLNV